MRSQLKFCAVQVSIARIERDRRGRKTGIAIGNRPLEGIIYIVENRAIQNKLAIKQRGLCTKFEIVELFRIERCNLRRNALL